MNKNRYRSFSFGEEKEILKNLTKAVSLFFCVCVCFGAAFSISHAAFLNTFSDSTQGSQKVKKWYRGIDISHHNNTYGIEANDITPNDSLTFAICKATQSINMIDTAFTTNWGILRHKGLLIGAYHFYQVNDDPIRQAEFFWNTVSAQGRTDLALVVDIEGGSLSKTKLPLSKIHRDLFVFFDTLEKKSGRVPMIYTSPDFANRYLDNPRFSKYPLWLAYYPRKPLKTVPKKDIPKTWKKVGYKIWQKLDSYHIKDDKRQNTDFDVYYGTKADLIK